MSWYSLGRFVFASLNDNKYLQYPSLILGLVVRGPRLLLLYPGCLTVSVWWNHSYVQCVIMRQNLQNDKSARFKAIIDWRWMYIHYYVCTWTHRQFIFLDIAWMSWTYVYVLYIIYTFIKVFGFWVLQNVRVRETGFSNWMLSPSSPKYITTTHQNGFQL